MKDCCHSNGDDPSTGPGPDQKTPQGHLNEVIMAVRPADSTVYHNPIHRQTWKCNEDILLM